MTDRIRITDLRALTIHQAPANELQADITLALLDIAEAAHDLEKTNPLHVPATLAYALGRFDFEDA